MACGQSHNPSPRGGAEAMSKPLAFLWRDVLEASSYRFAFLAQFGGFLLPLLAFYFFSRLLEGVFLAQLESYGGDYFSFLLIGVALANYMSIALRVFRQSIRRAQTTGVLEALLSTPTSLPTIALSSSLYAFVIGTIHVAVYLAIGALAFGVDMSGANIPAAVLVLVLSVASTASIGIIAAGFVIVFKQGDPISMVFQHSSWLLSGVVYPVAALPSALQPLAWALPLTHSLEGMRLALLQGAPLHEIGPQVMALALFAGVLLPTSLLVFQYAVRRAKLHGSLSSY